MPKNTYRVSDQDFINAVKTSPNIYQALLKMGLTGRGAAYKSFRQRCRELNLDISHLEQSEGANQKLIRLQINDKDILMACTHNISRQSTLNELGLNIHSGSNVRWIDYKIQSLNINTEHWLGQGYLKNKNHSWSKKIPLSEILVKESTYANSVGLKKRLVSEQLLKYICYECGIIEWNGKKLSLQLEHKNGDHRDNRIENLCLLCPNCHSQTSTFCRGKSHRW